MEGICMIRREAVPRMEINYSKFPDICFRVEGFFSNVIQMTEDIKIREFPAGNQSQAYSMRATLPSATAVVN